MHANRKYVLSFYDAGIAPRKTLTLTLTQTLAQLLQHVLRIPSFLRRQGLNLPEVSLVCILDADAEGFLRSDTALLQMIGRATRHEDGRAVLYANRITPSMQRALTETDRRRDLQKK